jgi:hypothetical protein
MFLVAVYALLLVWLFWHHRIKNKYYNFWSTFDEYKDIHAIFFEYITGGGCNIYTEYGSKEPSTRTEKNIYWSAEPHNRASNIYDVNIVMDETEVENSIIYPLFAIESFNSWGLLNIHRFMPYKDRFCAFVVSNCGLTTDGNSPTRNIFYDRLSKYKHIHSYGKCLNNTNEKIPDIHDHKEYTNFLGRHKFMICFENTQKKYYLTEKLRNAWLGGTIPIYYGSEMSLHWLNPNSFLYLKDDSPESMNKLVEKIIELDNDDELYLKMFNEPLLIGNIPTDLDPDTIKNRLKKYIK